MNDRQTKTPLPSGAVWPPSPRNGSDMAPPVSGRDWFRPALWLGLSFNLLAFGPALEVLKWPVLSGVLLNIDWVSLYSGLDTAFYLALAIGVPFAAWQTWRRRKLGLSVSWELVGLALCFCPLPLGKWALALALDAKVFHPSG